MKICWDMLEGLYLNKKGNFTKGTTTYHYKESCEECGNPFLYEKRHRGTTDKFCSRSCAIKGERSHRYNKKGNLHPLYGKPGYNKGKIGPNSPAWRGGVVKNNLPLYDTYAVRLINYGHSVRRSPDESSLLETTCKKCNMWFLPTMTSVVNRISLVEKGGGEGHLYCSDECKSKCVLYGQNPEHLMSYDRSISTKINMYDRNPEMQRAFRSILVNRSSGVCEICGNLCDRSMVAHHITPVKICNNIMTWDIDNGLYLCSNCERRAHSTAGCRYIDLALYQL